MNKNEILNSNWTVRRNAAGNPNTPAEVLSELSKDSNWTVRRERVVQGQQLDCPP